MFFLMIVIVQLMTMEQQICTHILITLVCCVASCAREIALIPRKPFYLTSHPLMRTLILSRDSSPKRELGDTYPLPRVGPESLMREIP